MIVTILTGLMILLGIIVYGIVSFFVISIMLHMHWIAATAFIMGWLIPPLGLLRLWADEML